MKSGPASGRPLRGGDINAERFFTRLRPFASGCWKWLGGKMNSQGYGSFSVGRINHAAHRVSYAIHFGSLPAGVVVMHTCDNPWCVNPLHLQLGSQADNMADAATKSRCVTKRGAANQNSRLTAAKARSIRRLYAKGVRQVDLARRFRVCQATVSSVVRKETWAHV